MTLHGDTRIDNYFWLRDDERSRPEVLDYLREENEYGQQVMATQRSLQERVSRRAKSPRPTAKMATAIVRCMSRAVNTLFISVSRC